MTTAQPQSTTLAQARTSTRRDVAIGFGNLESFELMQRAAKLLSSSTLVPAAYRAWDEKKGENPNALANCVVSLNMAQRMGADPLMVMQNLYIVEGRPSWSSQWIIAAINGCGRFSPLRFDLKDLGAKEVEYEVTKWVNRERQTTKHKATVQNLECIAWAVEKETGERIESPRVSVEMAVKEGWYGKSGSKWQTMPEVMLRYRTASFFGKLYAPELLMGLQTVEEAQDIIEATTAPDGTIQVDVDSLRAKAAAEQPAAPDAAEKDPAGDVTDVSMNAPSSAAQAETTNPASAAGAAPAYLDADKVLASIKAAQDHDVLAVAADSIQDCDPARAAELKAAYQRRLDELDGVVGDDDGLPFPPEDRQPAAAAASTTRQIRNRRTEAADME